MEIRRHTWGTIGGLRTIQSTASGWLSVGMPRKSLLALPRATTVEKEKGSHLRLEKWRARQELNRDRPSAPAVFARATCGLEGTVGGAMVVDLGDVRQEAHRRPARSGRGQSSRTARPRAELARQDGDGEPVTGSHRDHSGLEGLKDGKSANNQAFLAQTFESKA
jgi:hypothetical protein